MPDTTAFRSDRRTVPVISRRSRPRATDTPIALKTPRRSCQSLIRGLAVGHYTPAVVGFCSIHPHSTVGGINPANDVRRGLPRDAAAMPVGSRPPSVPPPSRTGETGGGAREPEIRAARRKDGKPGDGKKNLLAIPRRCATKSERVASDRPSPQKRNNTGVFSMAKTQKTSSEAAQDERQFSTSNDDQASSSSAAGDRERTTPDAKRPTVIPDPRGIMSISLGDTPGSPRIQLRRSHKYKPMQILFDEKTGGALRLLNEHWTNNSNSLCNRVLCACPSRSTKRFFAGVSAAIQ
jgi:hypothetical protein